CCCRDFESRTSIKAYTLRLIGFQKGCFAALVQASTKRLEHLAADSLPLPSCIHCHRPQVPMTFLGIMTATDMKPAPETPKLDDVDAEQANGDSELRGQSQRAGARPEEAGNTDKPIRLPSRQWGAAHQREQSGKEPVQLTKAVLSLTTENGFMHRVVAHRS